MADKQIFELPYLTADLLTSDLDISFVAQVEGYDLDFQVSFDLLQSLFGGDGLAQVFGGDVNPDNSSGKDGDIYVQANGKIYQKSQGAWSLKVSIATANVPVALAITPATDPVLMAVPNGYSIWKADIYIPVEGGKLQLDNTRKIIDPVNNKLFVNTYGDNLTIVFF